MAHIDRAVQKDILRGSSYVIISGIAASMAFVLANTFRDVLGAIIAKYVPDDHDHHILFRILQFVVVSTVFTAIILLLYRYTRDAKPTTPTL